MRPAHDGQRRCRPGALVGGTFLFFALLGNVLGRVRRNFYIGVRVPWTLASERVWNDTHRVAAWLFVACGLAGFVIAVAGLPLVAAFAVLLVARRGADRLLVRALQAARAARAVDRGASRRAPRGRACS